MKLMVIDGNSIVNRAYYGIRPLSTRDGLYTHAIYGFLTTLQRLLDEEQPEALSGGLLHQTRCKSAVKACRLPACLYKCARSAVTFRAPERIIHRACGCAPAPALSPSRAP